MSEFFVGHQPLSKETRRKVFRGALTLALAFAGASALLVLSQDPFDRGTFEYGYSRRIEGWVDTSPLPSLRVPRPHAPNQTPTFSRYPLVNVGKFGAPLRLLLLHGKMVSVSGALIFNDSATMLEVDDQPVEILSDGQSPPPVSHQSLGEVDLVGEIVDSKCYLGVMKPGRRKTHRECAVRCLSGGVPALFVVEDEWGATRQFFLTSATGKPIIAAILDLVAERVRIRGRIESFDDLPVLRADPSRIERVQ